MAGRHVLWHVAYRDLGPDLGLEGHHSSPERETEEESACAYRLCCAHARCGAGLAAAAPPRTREHEGGLSHLTGASFCG
jgi:hypothetical protein